MTVTLPSLPVIVTADQLEIPLNRPGDLDENAVIEASLSKARWETLRAELKAYREQHNPPLGRWGLQMEATIMAYLMDPTVNSAMVPVRMYVHDLRRTAAWTLAAVRESNDPDALQYWTDTFNTIFVTTE